MERLVRPFFQRYFIFFIIAAYIGLLILLIPVRAHSNSLKDNPIVQENQKHGTTQWESKELEKSKNITFLDLDKAGTLKGQSKVSNKASSTWTDTTIRGFANTTSINHGDAINFYVGTTHLLYSIQIYRMGWYGGTGSTLVTTISNLSGQNQPIPSADPTTQLLELNWNVSYTLQTDTTWTTGMYLAKLIATDDGSVGYIPFVIRDDSSTADILYQVPVNTWQAYNAWGGSSLYTSPGRHLDSCVATQQGEKDDSLTLSSFCWRLQIPLGSPLAAAKEKRWTLPCAGKWIS